ncbi:hypothetical protein [Desulfosporosinus lacus]|uniref:DUF3953 domain-containing protein n=1 Tax=Desulfosporosinus lacus DSM 15449 TaxID=1121420 RepID=A0A1M6GSS6_9FIRM|nr:hypothetical protein [Desulfosporosinus lacus]SHJ13014.1 hypothetical protein SAMN02746098_05212 [Desulfosporosinus lacus DSM 15449]
MNKRNKLFTSINIFKFLIGVSVMMLALYNLFINSAAIINSMLIIQLLFALLLIVSGIQSLKDDNENKRRIAYAYFIIALVVLILNLVTFLRILKI